MPDAYALRRRDAPEQWVCGYQNGVPGFVGKVEAANTWACPNHAVAVWNDFVDEWREKVELRRVAVKKQEVGK